jgi:hypothetical protein
VRVRGTYRLTVRAAAGGTVRTKTVQIRLAR